MILTVRAIRSRMASLQYFKSDFIILRFVSDLKLLIQIISYYSVPNEICYHLQNVFKILHFFCFIFFQTVKKRVNSFEQHSSHCKNYVNMELRKNLERTLFQCKWNYKTMLNCFVSTTY